MRTYAVNRSGAFTGPARSAPRRVTAHTLCEGCKHPRSDHPKRGACTHEDGPFVCQCQQFTVPAPTPKKARRSYTDEEVATWQADLEAGYTYRETSRRRDAPEPAIRYRLPGFKGNSHNPSKEW